MRHRAHAKQKKKRKLRPWERIELNEPESSVVPYAGQPVDFVSRAAAVLALGIHYDAYASDARDFYTQCHAVTGAALDAYENPDVLSRDQWRTLFGLAWELYLAAHRHAMGALSPDTHTEGHAVAGWAAFCAVYYARDALGHATASLAIDRDRIASAYPFCSWSEELYSQIVVSERPIMSYGVRDVWDALTNVLPTLYVFPYSSEMHAYYMKLFVRHCELLLDCDARSYRPLEDGGELFSMPYDSPIYCYTTEEEEIYLRSADGEGSLATAYLADSELLVGCQLKRMARSFWLQGLAKEVVNVVPPTREIVSAMAHYLREVAQDLKLREFVSNDFRGRIMRTQLLHGESARFMRHHPRQDASPDNVIAALRYADYAGLTELSTISIGTCAERYATGLMKMHDAARPWETWTRCAHEREVVLSLYLATDVWVTVNGVPGGYVKRRFYAEDLEMGTDEALELSWLPPERPAFVRCMRWNYVFEMDNTVSYASPSLPDAFLAWLQSCYRTGFASAENPTVLYSVPVHETLASVCTFAGSSSSSVAETAPEDRDRPKTAEDVLAAFGADLASKVGEGEEPIFNLFFA